MPAAPLPISSLTIWTPEIPLRRKFKHAAAERTVSRPIIVGLELANGVAGYGETHPRTYVTGESEQDVLTTIHDLFVPLLVETRPTNFGEAVEAAANLPLAHGGRTISAARAAVELALLDAYGRAFGRSLELLAGWFGEPWLGTPGSRDTARYSGVIASDDADRVRWSIRKMRLFGLRHFKLKVGDASEDARLAAAVRALGRSLLRGRTTLRLDANGAWSPEQASQRLRAWEALPIACVEQPLAKDDVQRWAELARQTNLPLMADESLVTHDDAEGLIVHRAASWFNIRISKNGGLIPAIQLAVLARRHDIQCQLGCMVGETSILSAAGRWFLQLVPGIRFAEGSFGRMLLQSDVLKRPLQFGYGGRWKPLAGPGLGVEVDPDRLKALCLTPPAVIRF